MDAIGGVSPYRTTLTSGQNKVVEGTWLPFVSSFSFKQLGCLFFGYKTFFGFTLRIRRLVVTLRRHFICFLLGSTLKYLFNEL